MEPSTSSASSGLFFGITSASTDVRSDRGASGNCPRIAWLPITMISRSSAMLDAARMTCSSWLLRKEYPPLPRAENAGEGGRGAKPFRFFRCAAQDADGFLDPPGKNRFPLPEGGDAAALPPPAPGVLLRPLVDARVLPQFFRDGSVHGQAAPVDLPVAGARRPVRWSRGGPRFPSRQVEKFLFPLVEVAGGGPLDLIGPAPAGLPGKPRKPRFQFRAQANGEHGAPPM